MPVADFALAGAGLDLLLPPLAAVDRPADPADQHVSWPAGWNRMLSGLPLIMVEAHGPGRIALSGDRAGDVVALPLTPGQHDLDPRAPVPDRHRQRRVHVAERPASGTRPAAATTRRRTTRSASSATSSPRSRHRGCCCCTRPATRSCVTSRPARRSLVQPGALLYRDVAVAGAPAPGVPVRRAAHLVAVARSVSATSGCGWSGRAGSRWRRCSATRAASASPAARAPPARVGEGESVRAW